MELVKKIAAKLFASKKVTALLAGLALKLLQPLAVKIGWTLSPDDVNWALALIASYLVGQGLADVGKERAKVEQDTALMDFEKTPATKPGLRKPPTPAVPA